MSSFHVAALVMGQAALAQGSQPAEPDQAVAPLAESTSVDALTFAFEGFVLAPDGQPTEGALVVSSAGGRPFGRPLVNALSVHDDGGGPALFIAGEFRSAGPLVARRIAKWDGSAWSRLGSGFQSSPLALASFDDGLGTALFAGGIFTDAGGVPARRIAKWDGMNWSEVGNGANSTVQALAVYDAGVGAELYAGGSFTGIGGQAALRVARWDGTSWSALDNGVGGSLAAGNSLAVFDSGVGAELIAAGTFTCVGGQGAVCVGGLAANRIAKWDGSAWSILGSGLDGLELATRVHALAVGEAGAGPALFVGGQFTLAGGLAVNHVAQWDGLNWSALGAGVSDALQGDPTLTTEPVKALATFDDRSGQALFVGGAFDYALDSGDSFLAKWGCPDITPPTLNCPPGLLVFDGGSNGHGEVVHFTLTASDDMDPAPTIVCTPASGSFFPRGKTIVRCVATDAAGNQSTCHFPVRVNREHKR